MFHAAERPWRRFAAFYAGQEKNRRVFQKKDFYEGKNAPETEERIKCTFFGSLWKQKTTIKQNRKQKRMEYKIVHIT